MTHVSASTHASTSSAPVDAKKKGEGKAPAVIKADKADKSEKGAGGAKQPTFKFAATTPPDGPVALKKIVFAPFEGRAAPSEPDEAFLKDIKLNGIIQPVSGVLLDDGTTLLVIGRRRVRAATILEFATVPMHYIDVHKIVLSPDETITNYLWSLALSENLNRANLNAWDQFIEFQRMVAAGANQSHIARHIGKSDGYVSQYMSFAKLPPKVREIIRVHSVDSAVLSKAIKLHKLEDYPDAQLDIAKRCFDKASPLTFAQLSDLVETHLLKLQEAEEKAAKRAEAREKAKKAAERGEPIEAGAADEEEIEEDPYAKAEVEIANKTFFRAYLTHAQLRFNAAKELPEGNAEERLKKAEKVGYERGRLDAMMHATGLKTAPKSVTG